MLDLSPSRFLTSAVREHIEQIYYQRVNEQSKLEWLLNDPHFFQAPEKNPAFFSDHGVVHVRNVARQILEVLHAVDGVLIPRRTEQHMLSFMYGCGTALAYLHDIGMSDLSKFGRAMHPEFAAHAVFDAPMDDVVNMMWEDNCGNLAWNLSQLSKSGAIKRDPQIVFRELLSLSIGHSKSKVPMRVLDNPVALREYMQSVISHNLPHIYYKQQRARGSLPPEDFTYTETPPSFLQRFYTHFTSEAYDWLTDESTGAKQLTQDVTDTLRALRCADALRQRGTVEKTSGGYEIYTSQKTGDCVIALRLGADHLYLMELPDNRDGAGEANIASSEFTSQGDIRISLHRGAFENKEAQDRSAYSTAYVIADFLRDTVDSFWRANPLPGLKKSEEILILLESNDDDPQFAPLVREHLCQLNPRVCEQVHIAPSLRNVSESERARYLQASDLNWDAEYRQAVLEQIKRSGQKLTNFDPVDGFRHVKRTELPAGEKLIEAGTPSAFVYIPLGDGLRIIPLGGYQSFTVAAWMPLGTTGVIRGDIRNADIIAEKTVALLILPKEIYLRYWYVPYSPDELKQILTSSSP